ncbi:hypothetical protein E2C01_043573 [Portunus trituberculatus]|uniref:Uncharacterized protein n=1 Tax=Portunus trituberculatus TaxID=210409 RepID=A0A5B7FPU3_PORTR|nr:hypothetical protein [Portunus trituberculatus]
MKEDPLGSEEGGEGLRFRLGAEVWGIEPASRGDRAAQDDACPVPLTEIHQHIPAEAVLVGGVLGGAGKGVRLVHGVRGALCCPLRGPCLVQRCEHSRWRRAQEVGIVARVCLRAVVPASSGSTHANFMHVLICVNSQRGSHSWRRDTRY